MLDEKFNIKCETGYIAGEDNGGLVITDPAGIAYRIPCLSYEELIQKADEYLGDHVPTDEIKERYGIK